MQIKLIPATARDLDDISPFLRAGIDAGFPSRSEAAAVLGEIVALLDQCEAAPIWASFWAVAQPGDAAVGLCGYKGPPGPDGFVEIAYFTFPRQEGRGVATAMAGALIDTARAQGAAAACAHTLREENASVAILRKLGFALVGEAEDPDDGTVWRWELAPPGRRRPERRCTTM